MFDRIVVPLDGSELADRILGPLRRLLQAGRRELVLLHVVPGLEAPEAEPRERALAHLEPLRRRLAEEHPEARVTIELFWGDPAEKVLQYVKDTRPGLVAMATHGRTGLTRLVRGSVAERVLRHCSAPLLLCTPRALEASPSAPFQRVLAPLDGSEAADRVLPLVEALARTYAAEVTLLGVEPVASGGLPLPEDRVDPVGWNPGRVERDLRPRRARLAQAGITTRTAAARGIPAEEILRAAAGAELVAMTTHGWTGASRWWFGSTAEQVLRHCPVPVLVQRVV